MVRARLISDWFLPGTEPKRQSTIVQKFPVDRASGKLAIPGTPPENVEERTFYVFPPQAQDWYSALSDEEKGQLPRAAHRLGYQRSQCGGG